VRANAHSKSRFEFHAIGCAQTRGTIPSTIGRNDFWMRAIRQGLRVFFAKKIELL